MNYLNEILVQLYGFLKTSGAWAYKKSRAWFTTLHSRTHKHFGLIITKTAVFAAYTINSKL